MPTSLISRIKRDSLIVFKSANEDIELFGNSDKKFSFSHFALLNLPDIRQSVDNSNVLDFERIQSRFLTGNSVVTPPAVGDSIDLSESLQNYLLNFEDILTTSSNYDRSVLKNTNERIFFKWLKEVGAVRYRGASQLESNFNGRFCEETDNSNALNGNIYERVVKYIGDISIQNKVTNTSNTFEEVFVHVPSFAGNTPNPLFKTVEDVNYAPSTPFFRPDIVNSEWINGYDGSDSPVNELNLEAQYDIDVQGLVYASVNSDNPMDTDMWNSYYGGEDAYLTDKTFLDSTNDEITVVNGMNTKTYLRSRLDGVVLDLDKSSYAEFNTLSNKAFSELSVNGTSFDFNAVLLYYQLEKNGTIETNLFGVYFLDDVVEVSGGLTRINRLPKIKGSTLLGQSGNGFGFKINFRVDSASGDIVVEVSSDVDSYNVFSMQLFSETMGKINKVLVDYETLVLDNAVLKQQVIDLIALTQQNNTPLTSQQVDNINQQLVTSGEFQILSSQYTNLQNQLTAILQGNTSVDVNLVFQALGIRGVTAELVNNTLKVGLTPNDFSSSETKQIDVNIGNEHEFSVGYRNKLAYIESQANVMALDDINIFLDETLSPWQNLQTVSIFFSQNIDFGDRKINIFTDKQNQFSNFSYGYLIATIAPKSNRVDVVCIDASNYTFIAVS